MKQYIKIKNKDTKQEIIYAPFDIKQNDNIVSINNIRIPIGSVVITNDVLIGANLSQFYEVRFRKSAL